MSKNSKVDKELLSILDDYHLFMDSDKTIDMPFCVNKVDNNHITSLKGETDLRAACPFGNTIIKCQVRNRNEFDYSISILSDRIKTRMLFRLDEGDGTHWNRHFPIPIEQQQVPCPHFHKKGDDGIEYAYRTNKLEVGPSPLNIHDGFEVFCEECHIKNEDVVIKVQEEGMLPFEFEQNDDPLKGINFP